MDYNIKVPVSNIELINSNNTIVRAKKGMFDNRKEEAKEENLPPTPSDLYLIPSRDPQCF